jgi:hypothetical protein
MTAQKLSTKAEPLAKEAKATPCTLLTWHILLEAISEQSKRSDKFVTPIQIQISN